MSSKTKIVVLHLKELIYTGIFVLFGILFLIMLIIMFVPKDKKEESTVETPAATYVPGIYTTSLIINDNVVDVENITYADENKYTSMVLLSAIRASLDKAAVPSASPSADPSPSGT